MDYVFQLEAIMWLCVALVTAVLLAVVAILLCPSAAPRRTCPDCGNQLKTQCYVLPHGLAGAYDVCTGCGRIVR